MSNINVSQFDSFLAGNGNAIIIPDIPAEEYHAEKRFVSKHALDQFADSAEKYKFIQDRLAPEDDSAVLRFGEAFHTYVLEPEKFDERYIMLPADIKIKKGKAWDEFNASNVRNRIVLTANDVEKLEGMKKALLSHSAASLLLFNTQGKAEQTVLWKIDGRPCKARIDRFIPDMNVIVDLKTCQSAAPNNFIGAVERYRYDVQGSFYSDAMTLATGKTWKFAIVAVEKEPPYAVAVYYLSQWMKVGQDTYLRDFVKLIEAEKTNTWAGYSVPDDELPMPKCIPDKRKLTI